MPVRDLWVNKRTKMPTKRYGMGNRYQAVWYVDGSERSKTFPRKVDAERHLAVTVTAQLSGEYVDPRTGQVTVQAFAERWLADQLQLRSGSRARYRFHLTKHVYPVIGSRPIRAVRKSTIQGLVSGLVEKGLAPGTVRGIYRTISIVFRAAVADQVIARSPCVGVKVPAAAESRAVALTVEQLRGLAEHLPPHFAALPLVGGSTGLRPAELFGIEVDPANSLDMLGRRVRVRQQLTSDTGGGRPYLAPPKTAAGVRDVPLAPETVALLAAHMERFPPLEVELEDRTGPRPVKRTARLVFYAVEERQTYEMVDASDIKPKRGGLKYRLVTERLVEDAATWAVQQRRQGLTYAEIAEKIKRLTKAPVETVDEDADASTPMTLPLMLVVLRLAKKVKGPQFPDGVEVAEATVLNWVREKQRGPRRRVRGGAHQQRTPIRRSTFNTTWTRAVERARGAGVELPARVTPHSLRHTYVSFLIAAGRHPKTIQSMVGHKSITETMDTYGHLMPDQHETTRDAIGAALRRDEAPGLRSVQI